MMALTGGRPKEMIPVAGVPAVERVARECAASGIAELLVVVAPGKDAIVEHLAPLAGTPGMPRTISFAVQPVPRGLADAIRVGRDFAGDDALAVALPDNLFTGEMPAMAQVIETYRAAGASTVAVVELTAAEAASHGATAAYPGTLDGDVYRIASVPGKGDRGATFSTGGAASAFTAVGRYVFTRELWDAIQQVERSLAAGEELDDVPVMRRLLAADRLVGRRLRGRFLDVGVPDGYHEADRLLAAGG